MRGSVNRSAVELIGHRHQPVQVHHVAGPLLGRRQPCEVCSLGEGRRLDRPLVRSAVSPIGGGERPGVVGIGLPAIRPLMGQQKRPDERDALLVAEDELGDELACAPGLSADAGRTAGAELSLVPPPHTQATPARMSSCRRGGRKSADIEPNRRNVQFPETSLALSGLARRQPDAAHAWSCVGASSLLTRGWWRDRRTVSGSRVRSRLAG